MGEMWIMNVTRNRCKMAVCCKFLVLFFTVLFANQVCCHVIDLDETFNELKKDGRYWFVEFYAPWCGHCKRLEPIWEEVGADLSKQSSNIVVARIDCTKYRGVAEEHQIRGFPTLRFFRGNLSSRYSGSHTKDALVEFAFKASRPILTEFKTTKEFEKRKSSSDVFFVFVKDEQSHEYKKIVQEIAEQKISQVMFYAISSTLLPEEIKLEKVPNLLVFKDGQYFTFDDESRIANKTSLSSWVDQEKFPPFMYISDSNVNELAETGKMVIFLTFSKDKEHNQINRRLAEIGKKMAVEMYSTYGKHFQFAGLFSTDVIESIIMSTVEVPLIMVLSPETRVYYLLPASQLSESFNQEQLETFLKDILDGKAVAYGGKTFSVRMWRIWWDVRSSAKDIWSTSPMMAILIFGLPFLVFTFLIVMLCCLESPEEDQLEHEDNAEQREVNGDEKDEHSEHAPVPKPTRLKED